MRPFAHQLIQTHQAIQARQAIQAFQAHQAFRRGAAGVFAAAALVLATAAASAQSAAPDGGFTPPSFPDLAADERPISEREWRALTRGKTLYYHEWGRFTGRERYDEDGRRVMFKRTEGRGCITGTYDHQRAPAGGAVFCFYWDEPVCFQHFRRDGKIFARRSDGGEAEIFRITDEVIGCDDNVS